MAKQKKSAATPWKFRIVGHAKVKATSLTANPLNFREHPDTQRAAVAEAIEKIGWVESVLVNRTTGHLLNGHLRVELAARRNEEVPVDYCELTEHEERLVLASIDPLSSLAVTDNAKLSALLSEIDLGTSALDSFLASGMDLQGDFADLDELSDRIAGHGGKRAETVGTAVKAVVHMTTLATFEKALRATGESNREKALLVICEAFLHAKGQFDFPS